MNTTVRPTLGVQLIVKNEAELLPRCLSTLGGADEIIVVDTGSTDQSIAVAEKYGATVVEEPWAEDFSAARNTGLTHAASDWILVLDADETLQHSVESIKDKLRGSTAEAYTVRIENLLGSRPEDRLYHSNVRLFRNGQGYRFSGRIHERVDDSIISRHGAAAIEPSDIEILHYGYLPGIMSAKNKISRNEHLLRLALAEEPDDPFYSYNLAVTCCQDGRLQEAEELLRRTLDTAPLQVSYRPSVIRDLCTIYQATSRLQALDSLLSRELARYRDYPDLHYMQGQSWESQGHLERAFQSYQHALDTVSAPAPRRAYVTEQGMNSFRPLYRMGVIAQQLGNQQEAARLFHRALQHYNLYLPALEGIAAAFQELEVPDGDIAGLLIQLAGTEQKVSRSAIIGTLYKLGAYQAIAKLPPGRFPLEEDTLLCILSSWIIAGKYHAYMQAAARLRAGTLQLSARGLDAVTLRQLWLLEAVSTWELGEKLQEELWQQAPAELKSGLFGLDARLASSGQGAGPAGLQAQAAPSVDSALLGEVIRLSVKLQYKTLGNTLAECFPSHTSILAEALYEEGWRAEAGELFISLVDRKEASGATLRYLAELLADQGHYTEAAGWYRLALEDDPASGELHAGLALCYLHLAEQGLKEVTGSSGEEQTSGALQEDLAAITRSIGILNRTPWHTKWTCKQRQRGAELSL
ncbi:glycosyltransferase [Paenibacillus sp. FSL K6-1096]|uniref:glycosyltransferase n=1 Tax=Paenibacillus sp. FSL K6-1096 TaxID=2921460 RepID=UPI0030ECF358